MVDSTWDLRNRWTSYDFRTGLQLVDAFMVIYVFLGPRMTQSDASLS